MTLPPRGVKTVSVPKPVYALVGSDALLQQEALREIVAQMPADVQRIDADGETAALADVLDELRSFAMFGSAKIVAVRNADEFVSRFREQLEDYVARPSDSATLVLRFSSLPSNQRIHKAITKTGQIIPCQPPKERQGLDRAAGKGFSSPDRLFRGGGIAGRFHRRRSGKNRQ